jgi:predicted RNA polymerase sigma factor
MRPALCDDALRLGRMLAARAPAEPEVHGLVALMELQASRMRARTTSTGAPILLDDQDRAKWNRAQIHRGLQALARADAIVSAANDGRAHEAYALQAAIAACHAVAVDAAKTDWTRIASLYADLARVAPSPIVELNRAVAVSRASGAGAGLAIVDSLVDDGALSEYALLYAVRADLLAKLDRKDEARADLARAASLSDNARERAMLEERARAL